MTSRSFRLLVNTFCGAASIALLVAFAMFGTGGETKDLPSGVPWIPADIIGYHYSLDHPTVIAEYRFTARGEAIATVGSKTGPVTGPVMFWRIDEKGVLHLGQKPGESNLTLIKIELTEDRVVVLVAREREEYRRTKVK